MNKEQKNDYHNELENYYKQNNINDIFDELMEQIVVNLPENPINFLKEFLKTKMINKKLIFIIGNNEIINKLIDNLKLLYSIYVIEKNELNQYKEKLKFINENFIIVKNFPNNLEDLNLINSLNLNYSKFFMIENSKLEKEFLDFIPSLKNFIISYKNYSYPDLETSIKLNLKLINNNYKKYFPPKILVVSGESNTNTGLKIINEINHFFKLEIINKNDMIKKEINNNSNTGKLFQNQKINNEKLDSLKINSLVLKNINKPELKEKGYFLLNYPEDETDFDIISRFKYNYNLVVIINGYSNQNLINRFKKVIPERILELNIDSVIDEKIIGILINKFY